MVDMPKSTTDSTRETSAAKVYIVCIHRDEPSNPVQERADTRAEGNYMVQDEEDEEDESKYAPHRKKLSQDNGVPSHKDVQQGLHTLRKNSKEIPDRQVVEDHGKPQVMISKPDDT